MTGGAALFLFAAWFFTALIHRSSSAPVVERTSIVVDVARRGELVDSVNAQGTLTPERVRIVSAAVDGVIETIQVRPGSVVRVGSVIATLSNPELHSSVTATAAQITAARANVVSTSEAAKASLLDDEAALANQVSDADQADAQYRAYRQLEKNGLIPDMQYRLAQIKATQTVTLVSIARRKIDVDAAEARAKIAAAQARVGELMGQLGARDSLVTALVVRTGASGIVQSVAVERGMRVTAGAEVARVVGQRDLKAVVEVPEAEIHSVLVGMNATVQTHDARYVRGTVARISPAAQNGAVAVDVKLFGPLPPSARPDLNVDATIEVARLSNVISIARPTLAANNSIVDVYRLVDGGRRAVRTKIRVGAGSLERVEVRSGLAPGMPVIVSDTAPYGDAPELRIQ